MKKIFVALFAFVYLTVSGGVAVTVHYCMGKGSFINNEKCGKLAMMPGTKGCCKSETKFLKLKDAHKLVHNNFNFCVPVQIEHTSSSQYDPSPGTTDAEFDLNNNSPPVSQGIDYSILYSIFRI